MKIEALRPLHIRRATGDLHLKPGLVVDLADDDAIRLMAKVPGAVRPVPVESPKRDPVPETPLLPGWKVAFRERGRLLDGIVKQCIKTGQSWTVELSKGHTIPLQWITSIGKTDADGHVISAWDVRAHGLSGHERRTR